jgi:hypothetical protein
MRAFYEAAASFDQFESEMREFNQEAARLHFRLGMTSRFPSGSRNAAHRQTLRLSWPEEERKVMVA